MAFEKAAKRWTFSLLALMNSERPIRGNSYLLIVRNWRITERLTLHKGSLIAL